MSDRIAIDFIEFDEIRAYAKSWIHDWRKTHPKLAKGFGIGVWENSSFYVGRTTTSVKPWGIAIPFMACGSLGKALQEHFPEYRVAPSDRFRELRIYLR